MQDKEFFMNEALNQAKKAYKKQEIPVGAVIVKNGKIIAKAYNLKETKNNTLAHAEMIAISKASKKLKAWRLTGCEMYITLEPCPMCAGAIMLSRIDKIYIGTMDKKTGACGSVFNMFEYKFNHKVETQYGILEKECSNILKDFFKNLRNKKEKEKINDNKRNVK